MVDRFFHANCPQGRLLTHWRVAAPIFAVTLAVTSWQQTAQAASSDWVDLGGGAARLVATLDPAAGTISGVVEVQLEPGWKTYWRSPGSSGIPPEFIFTAQGYTIGRPQFPSPEAMDAGGAKFYGYSGAVRFPFEGTEAGGGDLTLDMLIGVCDEVCIPATAQFQIDEQDLLQSDPAAQAQIAVARAALPAPLAKDAVQLQPAADRMAIQLTGETVPDGLNARIAVEVPGGWVSDPVSMSAKRRGLGATVSFPARMADTLSQKQVWHVSLLLIDPQNGSVRSAKEALINTPAE